VLLCSHLCCLLTVWFPNNPKSQSQKNNFSQPNRQLKSTHQLLSQQILRKCQVAAEILGTTQAAKVEVKDHGALDEMAVEEEVVETVVPQVRVRTFDQKNTRQRPVDDDKFPVIIGKNRHMGELPPILALLQSPGMSDASILAVVNPTTINRERSDKLNISVRIEDAYMERSKMLPSHADWRYATKIGTTLNRDQIVRSNHFQINERSIKPKIFQYVVHIYRYNRTGEQITKDCAPDEDSRLTTTLVLQLKDNHSEWGIGHDIGFTYDGRSLVYTSHLLPFANRELPHDEILCLKNLDGTLSRSKFRVVLTLTDTIIMPNPTAQSWRNVFDERILNALDSAVLSFARWGIVQDSPTWFTVGSKAFRTTSDRTFLSPAYSAQCGYYAGLKSCMAGLVLVSDMSVSCFLNGGRLMDIMWSCGGFRDFEDMLNIAKKGPIPPQRLAKIAEAIKGAKVKLLHLGRYGKVKKLGPPPNSGESSFVLLEKNVRVTVEDYYRECAKVAGSLYKKALPGGKLKYPSLPCVNLGSDAKPNYVPAELIEVPGGQCRSKVCTPQMTAEMIKVTLHHNYVSVLQH
jgi:hypothetical protein